MIDGILAQHLLETRIESLVKRRETTFNDILLRNMQINGGVFRLARLTVYCVMQLRLRVAQFKYSCGVALNVPMEIRMNELATRRLPGSARLAALESHVKDHDADLASIVVEGDLHTDDKSAAVQVAASASS